MLNENVGVIKVYINNEPNDLPFSTGKGVIIPKGTSRPVYAMGIRTPGGMYDIKIIFNSGQSLITIVRY